MTSQEPSAPVITADELGIVSRTAVFFGHQSVGMNVLGGVPGIYSAHGLPVPAIEQDRFQSAGGGFISHAFIGQNEDPLEKIRDFEAKMRSGIGQSVDVAMMKLCYVDINNYTEVDKLFTSYREAILALARDFPKVAFVHVTVPLVTEQGQLTSLKRRLRGNARGGPSENAARERLSSLIRNEYHSRLFDLAAVESTMPDGGRVAGTYRGQHYYALYRGYASDSGHLNAAGARNAATAWLKAIAQASPKAAVHA